VFSALGGCEPQLDVHINSALTTDEIVEEMLHSAVYCGMPKALNATLVAKKVFDKRGLRNTQPAWIPSAPRKRGSGYVATHKGDDHRAATGLSESDLTAFIGMRVLATGTANGTPEYDGNRLCLPEHRGLDRRSLRPGWVLSRSTGRAAAD
jgi:hypothetical protein